MTKQQIGKSGELLVQYKLLLHGIESSPLTTDSGIDLVAFSHRNKKAVTIQVKSNEPKPDGGKGKLALDWWVADDSPADAVAFVDLSTNSVWLFRALEVAKHAQQHSGGRYHFFMYVDPTTSPRKKRPSMLSEFEAFRFETRVDDLF
jgi:hypothetical protein